MLDGATIEDPFSILSASIEHPLQLGCESDASSREIAQRAQNKEQRTKSTDGIRKADLAANMPPKGK